VTATAATQDLATMERQTIEKILQQTDWNKSKTARRLGLTRTQLYVRLRRYGLERQNIKRHPVRSVHAIRKDVALATQDRTSV
jgi:DNA-binding NtrC family response regulator